MITVIQLGDVFRSNLRRLMAKQGWTQLEFAKQMDVSQPYASQLMSGAREPGLSTIDKVATLFGIQQDELLREPDEE